MSQSGLDKPLQNRTEAQARTEKARTDLVNQLRARKVERRGYDAGDLRSIPPRLGRGEYVDLVSDDLCIMAAEMIETLANQIKSPPRATLDEHCEHPPENISADGRRCLSCGAWL